MKKYFVYLWVKLIMEVGPPKKSPRLSWQENSFHILLHAETLFCKNKFKMSHLKTILQLPSRKSLKGIFVKFVLSCLGFFKNEKAIRNQLRKL